MPLLSYACRQDNHASCDRDPHRMPSWPLLAVCECACHLAAHAAHDEGIDEEMDLPVPAPLTLGDVAQFIGDPTHAATAFHELQRLQDEELIDVYLPAGSIVAGTRRFNVWLGHQVRPPHGERITLQEWANEWLASQGSSTGGDAA